MKDIKTVFGSEWSQQALKVLRERYLDRDETGEVVETPEQMMWRVAEAVAKAEARWEADAAGVKRQVEEFYRLLVSRKFLPNSPTLMNAGKGNGLQYSACFVLPVEDSLVGIFDAIKWQALIHQSGGGTGFGFSRLRPKGSFVRTSRGVASGPVSFMKIFDAATQQIKQGGTRRGANMGMLRIDHPDIREFITCKLEGGITNFNISVLATDKFMEVLEEGGDYELVAPHTGEVVGKENAQEIFRLICESAWKSGDPGMVFIDRINVGTGNPVPELGPIEATNPCGEQMLYNFDACNLGSIFLRYFVKQGSAGPEIDWLGLAETIKLAVRFLDDVIEVNPFPLQQIRKTVRQIRRIGLGVGGWADMLFLLGIAYNSDEACILAEKVMAFIKEEGHKASIELAKTRGPFPLWSKSIYAKDKPRRNSTVTTIAPTGSISIIADNSSGIEPIFALTYRHTVKDEHLDRELVFVNPVFKEIAQREGFWSGELEEKVARTGSVAGLEEVPERWRKVLVTSHEIEPIDHVKMQAAWQKQTDNAVSKTINLPGEARVEDVVEAYLQAWKLGCLGITVYRDGSKEWQVLNVGTVKEEKKKPQRGELRQRPSRLRGSTYKLKTPVGTAYVVVNDDERGNPFEVFINVGKAGSHVMADAEAMGRLISLSLRGQTEAAAGSVAEMVADQLEGIGGAESVGYGNGKVRSLADGVAKILHRHLEDQGRLNLGEGKVVKGDLCSECGQASLVLEEGCAKCYSCGASKC